MDSSGRPWALTKGASASTAWKKESTTKTWLPMWACSPTSSTEASAASRSTAWPAAPERQAEAELGVVLAGAHVLVGVGLDAGGDPDQDLRARRRPSAARRSRRSTSSKESTTMRPTPTSRARAQLGRRTCCCRAAPAGRRARRRRGPRGARRRWPRRGACPPRGPGGPWPCTGRPWWRRRRRRRRRRPPPGSGPAGGPRRRRTPACRTRRPGRAGRSPRPTGGRPSATVAVSGSRSRGSGGHISSGALGPEQVEADGQADPDGLDQPQPGLGQGRVDAVGHHVAVVVEAVEAPGQLPDPGGDLVGRPADGGRRRRPRAARTATAAAPAPARG